jgi:hypothetical protein
MKPLRFRPSALCLFGAGAIAAAHAAAPSVSLIKADQVLLGEALALHAEVADADGNLQTLSFYAAGPGLSGWQSLGTHTLSGAAAAVDRAWTPPQLGLYTIRVDVGDTLAATGSAQRTTQTFAQRTIVQGVNLPSGATQVFAANGEVRTKENTAGPEVVAQAGSTMVFWAQTRVVLRSGFRANTGAIIWAATDSDLDGYSDQEEATDSDGDGMCDAWEVDHGLNPFSAADAALDSDSDGRSNLAEYQANTDPNNRADAATLPGGYQLVLRLPSGSYAGLETGNWTLSGVANP